MKAMDDDVQIIKQALKANVGRTWAEATKRALMGLGPPTQLPPLEQQPSEPRRFPHATLALPCSSVARMSWNRS